MTTITNTKDGTTLHSTLLRQWVTEPLAAATLTGTVSGFIRCIESNSNFSACVSLSIRACSFDGGTIRTGGLAISNSDLYTGAQEMPTTTAASRSFMDVNEATALTLSSISLQDGDRLVIEVGFVASDTSTVRTGGIVCGDNSATDISTSGSTTANNPWVEFSQTLSFATVAALNSTSPAMGATGAAGSAANSVSVALTNTNVVGTGSAGTVTATSSYSVALTGVAGTTTLGDIGHPLGALAASGAVGTPGATSSMALTNVVGTGGVGTVTASTSNPDVTLPITYVLATGSAGSVTASVSQSMSLGAPVTQSLYFNPAGWDTYGSLLSAAASVAAGSYITIMAWAKWTSAYGTAYQLGLTRDTYNWASGATLWNNPSGYVDVGAWANEDSTVQSWPSGEWRHVTLVGLFDANGYLDVYVGGSYVKRVTGGGNAPTGNYLNVGNDGYGIGTSDPFDGRVVAFKFWTRALSAGEIAAEVNALRPQASGAYCAADLTGTTGYADTTGNGHNFSVAYGTLETSADAPAGLTTAGGATGAAGSAGSSLTLALTGNAATGSSGSVGVPISKVGSSVLGGGFATSQTLSVNCTGADYLIVSVHTTEIVSNITATYNSVAMTLLGERVFSINNQFRVQLWGLAAPAQGGAHDLVLSDGTTAHGWDIVATAYSGVAGVGTANSFDYGDTNLHTTISVTVTSATGELVIDATGGSNRVDYFASGSGQVLNGFSNPYQCVAQSATPGAASTVVSYSMPGDGDDNSVTVAIPLRPAAPLTSSVALTGVVGTGAVGDVTAASNDITLPLTGVEGTGSRGDLAPANSEPLAYALGTGSVGNLIATAETIVPITTVLGTGSPGDVTLGARSFALTGTNVIGTGSPGSVVSSQTFALTNVLGTGSPGDTAPSSTKAITNNLGNGAVGDATASMTEVVALTGAEGTGSPGSLGPEFSRALTGEQATGTAGLVTETRPHHDRAVTGVEGTGAVGTITTGQDVTVALTGEQAAGSVGSLTNTSTPALNGMGASASAGDAGPAISFAVTGNGGVGEIGVVLTGQDVAKAITGTAGSSLAGDVGPSSTVGASGAEGSGSPGNAQPTTALTGNGGTGLAGDLIQNFSVTLVGIDGFGAPGFVVTEGDTIRAITGEAGSGSAGSAGPQLAPALTGSAAASSVGDVTASTAQAIALTGVSGSAAPGDLTSSASLPTNGVPGAGATGTSGPSLSFVLIGATSSGAVGTVTTSEAQTRALSGVEAAGAVGTASPSAVVALSGVAGAGAVGSLLRTYAVTGSDATGQPGSITAVASTVALTGALGTGQPGYVATSGETIRQLTGAAPATAALGPLVGIAATSALTRVTGTGAPGTVVSSQDVATAISGNQTTASVGDQGATATTGATGEASAGAVSSLLVAVDEALSGLSAQARRGLLAPYVYAHTPRPIATITTPADFVGTLSPVDVVAAITSPAFAASVTSDTIKAILSEPAPFIGVVT
jgi:hypothetical protein